MATGVKTGGRQRGTNNKVTKDLRLLLKDLLTKEFASVGKHLNKVEPKERLELLVKLLPYALPRYDQISVENNPDANPIVEFYKSIQSKLIEKGYGQKVREKTN